jgi:hypothetical protein
MSETNLVPFKDMQSMAIVMARSNMFGKTAEQILPLMLIAQAEGLHPATAALEYDVIQGRPALKAQAALARFQKAGGAIEWITRTDAEATAKFSHPNGGNVTVTWDISRASRMGFTSKDNWKKQPGIMLQWRTVAEGVRACYPACLNRMYTEYEVVDMEPARVHDISQEKITMISSEPAQTITDAELIQPGSAPSEQPEETKDTNADIRKRFQALLENIHLMPMPEGLTVDQRKQHMRDSMNTSRGNRAALLFMLQEWERELAPFLSGGAA